MSRSSLLAIVAGLAFTAGTIAQPPSDKPAAKPAQPAAQPGAKPAQPGGAQPQLPPGWSEADMKACEEAGKPGPMHEQLAQNIGVWTGKCNMWMSPGTEPMASECTATITSVMDGRFTKCEVAGVMPMGPFNGFGINGYDNVAQKFQSTWIDNCGTGIMTGTGELSPDKKTLTWNYTVNCPIQKKAVTMRQVERQTGKDTMTLEMYGPEPKTGKEYKIMEISYTRKAGTAAPTTKPGTAR